MAIRYKVDIMAELKKKGYSSTKIREEKLIGQSYNVMLQRVLAGFAAGVMVAASVWSLLIPAMEQCVEMGHLAFVPAVVGFWFGILFFIVLDRIVFCMYRGSDQTEDRKPGAEDNEC